MRIAVACDHIVTDRKNHVVEYLKEKGHEVIDCGTYNNERTHYAIYGKKAAEKVVGGQADLGVVLCGTGVGITASTAKVVGTRPTLVRDISSAVYARKHLNANILGFGGRITGVGLMENIIDAFLETKFEPTEADNKIIEKIDSIAVAKEGQFGNEKFFDEFLEKWDRGEYHRWSLTPPFHPYPSRTGGLFSVALSLRSPWADVIRHRALWSPEVPQPIPMKITAAAIKRSQACNYT